MHVLLYLLVFCWADLFFAQLWTEQSILTASDKTSYDYFGSSVSLTDNYALVGASRCCLACNCNPSGFAYVFVRSGTTWSQQAKLTASIKAVDDYFGRSVSVTDNYAFVGAHNADSGALANAGAAYIFVRSGTSWTEQLILTASNKAADDQFGWSVSLTDNYALVGAHNTAPRSGEYGTGTAYVFIRSGASWTEQAILMASNRATGNRFGSSVSLTDNYALIGAPLANVGSVVSAGAAYVFGRSGTTWTEQAILTASSRGTGDNLGKFVSLTDNYALVGLYSSVSKSYIFSRSGSAWTLQTILPSVSSPSSGRRALAISNQYAIVENQIFTRSGNTWSSQASLSRSSLYSVAITTNYAIIGNGDVDFGVIYNAGQAYVFYASFTSSLSRSRSRSRSVRKTNSNIRSRSRTKSRSRSRSISRSRSKSRSRIISRSMSTSGSRSRSKSRSTSGSRSRSRSISTSENKSRTISKSRTSSKSRTKSMAILTTLKVSAVSQQMSMSDSAQKTETKSKSSIRSLSQSRTQSPENTGIPPKQELDGSSSASIVPIIVGSGAGILGLAAILFCVRKKVIEKRRQSSAAHWAQRDDQNASNPYKNQTMMTNLSDRPDAPPVTMGSVFHSKKPGVTSAPDPFMSNEEKQSESPQIHFQGASLKSTPHTNSQTVSRFNDYSDISEVSFSQLEPVGSGAFGFVYRVELSMGVVAVKVPKSNFKQGSKEYSDMLAEAEFLSKLRHTNITLLLGYGNHPSGTIVFLMEFADSSLADLLKSGPLQSEMLMEYAHGIVRGLLYLHIHSPPISHRDLKPENVLLIGGVAKLADFGLATARDFVSKTTGFAGTPVWSPPESFEGKFPGPPGDIYAFGLLLWSMMTGTTPYEGKQFNEVLLLKMKNQVPDIPSTYPSTLSKVMKQCWKMNPRHRITAPALEMAFNEIRNL